MFLLALDDGEGRLRDLIRLSFLLFFFGVLSFLYASLLLLCRFFSFLRRFFFFFFFYLQCVIALDYYYLSSYDEEAAEATAAVLLRCFVVFLSCSLGFFHAREQEKERERKKERSTHILYNIAINIEGKTKKNAIPYYCQVSFITLVVVRGGNAVLYLDVRRSFSRSLVFFLLSNQMMQFSIFSLSRSLFFVLFHFYVILRYEVSSLLTCYDGLLLLLFFASLLRQSP